MKEKFFDIFEYSWDESQSMDTTMSFNHCNLLREVMVNGRTYSGEFEQINYNYITGVFVFVHHWKETTPGNSEPSEGSFEVTGKELFEVNPTWQ